MPEYTETTRQTKTRTEPAQILQRMVEAAEVEPHHNILCYGCGRGTEVNWLQRRKFTATGYDPYPPFGYSEFPLEKFDFVFMVFLMTRLKTNENRQQQIEKAYDYVRPGGYLVIITRNWAKWTNDSENASREEAIDNLKQLMGGCEFDSIKAPHYETTDRSLCLRARKSGIYQPRNPIEWIDTQGEIDLVCARLQREKVVALDVETTLDEPRTLCTIQLGIEGQTYILDALKIENYASVKMLMEDPEVEKVIHNSYFEEQMLGMHGIRIRNIFDTLHKSRSKHKKSGVNGHKLGDVCERELGIYLDKKQQTSDWTLRPLTPEQYHYAAIDAEVLVDLYRIFTPPEPPKTMDLFALEE